MIESSREPRDESLQENDLASIRGEQPVAFEELLYPFLRLARETLRKETGAAYSLLAEALHRQWERSLLLSLDAMATATLDLGFTGFRTAHQISPAVAPFGLDQLPGTDSRQFYESFLRSLEGEGLLRLFREYPVLGRFLATRLAQWLDAAREFLLRLEADQTELETRYNQGQSLGPVIRLDPGLSDRHGQGRTALRVHIAAGAGLIYKPKMIAAEAAY
jgi:lantibiotic modifying enzyme